MHLFILIPLRDALTAEAAIRVLDLTVERETTPIGHVVDEKAIINGIVALLSLQVVQPTILCI